MFTINKTLLVCFCLSLFSSIAFAQRGSIEIATGGGVSMNNAPTANMPFTGTRSPVNYVAQLNMLYNIHRNISAGIELRTMELSRKSDSGYYILHSGIVGGDDRKIVYSDMMMSVCGVINGKINVMRGYFYGGVSVGYAFNIHDAAKIKLTNESYRAPNDGSGLTWGPHLGFTYGVNHFMALYVEGAMRKYYLSYNSFEPGLFPTEKLKYNITAYNFTVGLKFRIMPPRKVQNDIPGMRGQGRSL